MNSLERDDVLHLTKLGVAVLAFTDALKQKVFSKLWKIVALCP